MKRLLLFFILTLPSILFAQKDSAHTDTTTSVYGDLPVKQFYIASYSTSTVNGVTRYKIFDKEVSKPFYEYYYSTRNNMADCKPCILMTYDLSEHLLSKSIQYADCGVGYRIEYHLNGKVKLIGHYKENPEGNWDDAWQRGYCSRKDGAFSYFNDKEELLYSEYWTDGRFLTQIPEQKRSEAWDVEFMLDTMRVKDQELTAEQVKEIHIRPKFKNSVVDESVIKIVVEINSGRTTVSENFSIAGFSKIDLHSMFHEAGVKRSKVQICYVAVYSHNEIVNKYWLRIKPHR